MCHILMYSECMQRIECVARKWVRAFTANEEV